MGKMRMLSNVINHASNQVEGFCFIKTRQVAGQNDGNAFQK